MKLLISLGSLSRSVQPACFIPKVELLHFSAVVSFLTQKALADGLGSRDMVRVFYGIGDACYEDAFEDFSESLGTVYSFRIVV